MRTTILFIFLFSGIAYADIDTYVIEREDGGVSVMRYNTSSSDSVETALKEQGFEGRPVHKVTESELPPDRSDRNFWTWEGGKVKVSNSKKKVSEDKKAEKQMRRREVMDKIGITEEDLKHLLDHVS